MNQYIHIQYNDQKDLTTNNINIYKCKTPLKTAKYGGLINL